MVALGRVHGRVEFDQDVAGLDAPARPAPGSTRITPVSNGWMILVRPLGTILPVADATMSIVPQDDQIIAERKTAG